MVNFKYSTPKTHPRTPTKSPLPTLHSRLSPYNPYHVSQPKSFTTAPPKCANRDVAPYSSHILPANRNPPIEPLKYLQLIFLRHLVVYIHRGRNALSNYLMNDLRVVLFFAHTHAKGMPQNMLAEVVWRTDSLVKRDIKLKQFSIICKISGVTSSAPTL